MSTSERRKNMIVRWLTSGLFAIAVWGLAASLAHAQQDPNGGFHPPNNARVQGVPIMVPTARASSSASNLWDGTVGVVDGLATAGTATSVAPVVWSPTVGASANYIDTLGYAQTSFVVTIPSGATVVPESSADGTNWVVQVATPVNGSTPPLTSFGPITNFGFSVVNMNKYLRLRVSSYVSGTITVNAILRSNAGSPTVGAFIAAGTNIIGSVNALPKASASVTTAGCTVGVASAQCLAAATAVSTLTIQNTSAATNLACKWGGTAILNDSGSFMLAPGQARQWGVATAGLPNNALNCIASAAATPLYVEYN